MILPESFLKNVYQLWNNLFVLSTILTVISAIPWFFSLIYKLVHIFSSRKEAEGPFEKLNDIILLISSILFVPLCIMGLFAQSLVPVPDVTGFSYDNAVQTLKECGLEVSISESISYKGYVYTQNPEADVVVKKGTPVTLDFSNEQSIKSLQITKFPDKLTYYVGDSSTQIDTSGMILEAVYTDGETRTVQNGFTVAADFSHAGTHTVEVAYGGAIATFQVEVKEVQLECLEIKEYPTRTVYAEGDSLDLDGLIVMAVYNNGTTCSLDLDQLDISPTLLSTANSDQKISIRFLDEIVQYSVEVKSVALVSVNAVYTAEHTYYLGDSFDPEDAVVTAYYSDGSSEEIDTSACDIMLHADQANHQAVVEIYYNGKSAFFTIPMFTPTICLMEINRHDDTIQFAVETSPSDQEIVWNSSDPNIVTVSSSGTATAMSAGSAKITAEFNYCGYSYVAEQTLDVKSETIYGDWSTPQDEPIAKSDGIDVQTIQTYVRTEYLWGHYCIGFPSYITNSYSWGQAVYHDIGWHDSNDPNIRYYEGDATHAPGEYVYYPNGSSQFWRCSNTCFRLYILDSRDIMKTQYQWRSIQQHCYF